MQYLFKSERLGFRNWIKEDIIPMYNSVNSSSAVMEFFPKTKSFNETEQFVLKMQNKFDSDGFCYFAVDILEDSEKQQKQEFIGFIGLLHQNWGEDSLEGLDSFVDIGWRLKKAAWGEGYATEGAKACLDFGFNTKGLNTIYSLASIVNVKSINVMQKNGMKKIKTFEHPKLLENKQLKDCVLYAINKSNV